MLVPVLVTTDKQGVFFGYIESEPEKIETLPEKITIGNARNCIKWNETVRGFLGLASFGPNANCRIGPKVPKLTLFGITGVAICNPKAAEEWEKDHWEQ